MHEGLKQVSLLPATKIRHEIVIFPLNCIRLLGSGEPPALRNDFGAPNNASLHYAMAVK
jgi:hypothetical protein